MCYSYSAIHVKGDLYEVNDKYCARKASSMHVFLSITYKACILDSFVCVTYLHKYVCVTFDKVINIAPKSVKTKRGHVYSRSGMKSPW